MTIRIHEADGTPYEHVLDIRSPFKRYEVPFNTKYKRVRRNTKRYLARQAAAQAAAEGDAEAAEAKGNVGAARAILAYALKTFPDKKSLWRKAADLEKAHGTRCVSTVPKIWARTWC